MTTGSQMAHPRRPAYTGRFAPSPTGLLHAGSLLAALASWLDARAHGGRWLLRLEDVDTPRCLPGAAAAIVQQLRVHGLLPDAPPLAQSTRGAAYAAALRRLTDAGHTYPCGCSRQDIERALRAGHRTAGSLPADQAAAARRWGAARRQAVDGSRQSAAQPRSRHHAELVYPGTCRDGLHGKPPRAARVRSDVPTDGSDVLIAWTDRRLGAQQQNVTDEVGDFVLQRADGLWAYQLAVVVDDAAQGVTHVVRGEDLADNTPRQIHLQRLLGLPSPDYLHMPLVLTAGGEKLSKQNGARALDGADPLGNLRQAGQRLHIEVAAKSVESWLAGAVRRWRRNWMEPAGDVDSAIGAGIADSADGAVK